VAALDSVLAEAFLASIAPVHIETGKLKTSGTMESVVDEAAGTWTGTISYGGEQAPYAIYTRRTGIADAFKAAEALSQAFGDAANTGFQE
jgi:hypothetical protein